MGAAPILSICATTIFLCLPQKTILPVWTTPKAVKHLTGLKQNLSPNQAQTGFISGKYVHIFLQPAYKSIEPI